MPYRDSHLLQHRSAATIEHPSSCLLDECHKKTEIGMTGDTVYKFPKNEALLYDKDGQVCDADTKLYCKYTKEGRFWVGVSAVELSDDKIEGRRCKTFDYSAKNIITIKAE
jgi:hypothetical protein